MARTARLLLGAAAVAAAALGIAMWMPADDPVPPAPAGSTASGDRPAAGTVRAVAEALGRRHGVRIVFDPQVDASGPAPAVAAGTLAGLLLESTLREVLAGHELVFHYGPEAGGPDRLKAVWVFASQTPLDERAAAIAAAPSAAPQEAVAAAGPATRPVPPAPPAAAAPVESNEADIEALSPGQLRGRAEADPSEAVRLQALEALVAHPDADPHELTVLLDRLALDPSPLLAEQARALREARAAPLDVSLLPDPVE